MDHSATLTTASRPPAKPRSERYARSQRKPATRGSGTEAASPSSVPDGRLDDSEPEDRLEPDELLDSDELDEASDGTRTRVDPLDVARQAGLHYVTDEVPGIRRQRSGKGFTYRDAQGRTIRDRKERRRIEAIVIPPAWTDVWISADPLGHIQATGRDQRGRKQYRYHPLFRQERDRGKYSRMIIFGASLPRIRRRVAADLESEGLQRRRVLAATVRILDRHPIRVGNERYARDNDSYGLTTMRERHVQLEEGGLIRFRFRGKSGKDHNVGIEDADLARVIHDCTEVPGSELFKYVDEAGRTQRIDSEDVNAYLGRVSGCDFTAKDFRTWTGTVRMVAVLRELGHADTVAERKKRLVQAIKFVSADLNNTPATCRAFYIHPGVMEAYEVGVLHELLDEIDEEEDGTLRSSDGIALGPDELPVMALLPRIEAALAPD